MGINYDPSTGTITKGANTSGGAKTGNSNSSHSGNAKQGSDFVNGALGAVATRLSQAGLPIGGLFSSGGSSLSSNVGSPGATEDWRVKLSLSGATFAQLFAGSPGATETIMQNKGIVWPVTPFINMSHSANYDSRGVIHNNYPYYAYQNSQVDQITISGSFPVSDQRSGHNWLGTLHFLRTVTKMYYGKGANQGNPPPICRLNGYGDFVYKDVPVVVTNFNVELREAVDYIGVSVPTTTGGSKTTKSEKANKAGGGPAGMTTSEAKSSGAGGESSGGSINYVPTDSLIAVTCLPVYSRNKISNKFNLKSFAAGKLTNDGFI